MSMYPKSAVKISQSFDKKFVFTDASDIVFILVPPKVLVSFELELLGKVPYLRRGFFATPHNVEFDQLFGCVGGGCSLFVSYTNGLSILLSVH